MEVHFQCTIQICRYQCPDQCPSGPSLRQHHLVIPMALPRHQYKTAMDLHKPPQSPQNSGHIGRKRREAGAGEILAEKVVEIDLERCWSGEGHPGGELRRPHLCHQGERQRDGHCGGSLPTCEVNANRGPWLHLHVNSCLCSHPCHSVGHPGHILSIVSIPLA